MSISTVSVPPGRSGEPYKLGPYDGETRAFPSQNAVICILVSGKETDSDFAVVHGGGQGGPPIGFHYHETAHDVWYCLQGKVNIWAGDQCRTMEPGDFASAPPNCIHQYQQLGDHCEFTGIIFPGGWEEFLRAITEPYEGALFPTNDTRNPVEVFLPKFFKAIQEHDVIPVRNQPYFDPQPWDSGKDIYPSGTVPYFLKNNAGPRWSVGGLLFKPLIEEEQSNDKFAIAKVEGSAMVKQTLFEGGSANFRDVHHAFIVLEGAFSFKVDGHELPAYSGETLFVPSGHAFSFEVSSKVGYALIFAGSKGIIHAMKPYSEPYEPVNFSEAVSSGKTVRLPH